jgi:hypothetical protein
MAGRKRFADAAQPVDSLHRNDAMTNLMRWISQSMFHLAAERGGRESVDHVDGTRLADTDFWASSSMRLDDTPLDDFCETLPAFSLGSVPVPAHRKLDRAA